MSFERLQDNPFFVAARDVHNDLLDRCADEQLVLCVPQINSLDSEITSRNVLASHALKPTGVPGMFRTAAGQTVEWRGFVVTTIDGFDEHRECKIIETREVHTEAGGDIVVLLISRPLVGGIDAPAGLEVLQPKDIDQFLGMMQLFPDTEAIFVNLDSFLRDLRKVLQLDCWDPSLAPPLQDCIEAQCQVASAMLLKTSCYEDARPADGQNGLVQWLRHSWDLLCCAVGGSGERRLAERSILQTPIHLQQFLESYAMSRLHTAVLPTVQHSLRDRTLLLSGILKAIRDWPSTEFGVRDLILVDVAPAVRRFKQLNKARSPLAIMQVLRGVFDTLEGLVEAKAAQSDMDVERYELSTDDMQGLMALAIVKGYPKYATHELVVYIEYIDRFHFTDLRVGKLDYTLTTVKQLVEWLFTLADPDQQIGMPAYAREHIQSAAAAAGSDVSSFSYDRVAWRNRTNSRASKPQHPLSVGPGGGSTRGGEGGGLPDEALVVGVDGVQG